MIGVLLQSAGVSNVGELLESYDVELKAAQGGRGRGTLPDDVWETYSAFANTEGGWIVLGAQETDDGFEVLGLGEPQRVVKQLWDLLGNRQKISVNLLDNRDVAIVEEDGKKLVIIRVPRAHHSERPVHKGENPYQGTYLRLHEGDHRVRDRAQVDRMIADRMIADSDARPLDGFTADDLEPESVQGYRNVLRSARPDYAWQDANTEDFLTSLRALEPDRDGTLRPTRAGLLMFGRERAITRYMPHFFLDYREVGWTPARYDFRLCSDGTWPGNLFAFFWQISHRMRRDLPVRFELDAEGRRIEDPPHVRAVREALVNALVHAHYGVPQAVVVEKWPERFVLTNPGTFLVPLERARRGGVSRTRNHQLMLFFRLLGLAERTGYGIANIRQAWRDQTWRAPIFEEDFELERTVLTLPLVSLLPRELDEQLRSRFGDVLDALEPELRELLIVIAAEGEADHARIARLVEQDGRKITLGLQKLLRRGMIAQRGTYRASCYRIAESDDSSSPNDGRSTHNGGRSTAIDDRSTSIDDRSPSLDEVDAATLAVLGGAARAPAARVHDVIVELCARRARSVDELMALLRRSKTTVQRYVAELVASGRLRYRYPDKPTRHDQAYVAAQPETGEAS